MKDDASQKMIHKIFPNRSAGFPNYLVYIFCLLIISFFLTGCGYHNPYIEKEDTQKISKNLHITTWDNRTNELGLESVYFRILNAWFKNSSRINVTSIADQADLKLTGEIASIELPGLFYDDLDEAVEIKIKLAVRFTLRDSISGNVLWQERDYILYEPFIIDPVAEITKQNKKRALLRMGDEIAELIYLRTHEIVKNL
jgi:hypothetical protein